MRLKKLIIHGFKSFSDRTTLEFDDGITAIVGPNGCGKSNICDAFRWVLGEQSAKSMRGQKMGDIIFAGTSKRKALNFAEVTLVFTDVGDALPIEFEEVSVTRRLHRSGESQYLINRNPVRLKDVQNLFLDSGIGKNSFAFFEQGKIDQIINLGPNERRGIFEKAAGILRFLQRREEALRKLQHVGTNVTRVEDIHEEVEKQLALLEKQAEEARLFKENRDEFHTLEKAVAVAKWTKLEEQIASLESEEQEFSDSVGETRQKRHELQIQLKDMREALETAEKAQLSQHEEVYKQRNAKSLKAKEKETQIQRKKETEERKSRIHKDLRELATQLAQGQECYTKNKKDLEVQTAELEEAQKAYSRSQEALSEAEQELEEKRSVQQEAQSSRMKLIQEEGRLHSEQQQKQLRLETSEDKLNDLSALKEQLEKRLKELSGQLEEKQEHWNQCSKSVDTHKSQLAELEKQVAALKAQISEQQTALEGLIRERADVTAREKALRNLQKEHEGVSKGAKQLLKASQSENQHPLYGKLKGLYECLTAQSGAEQLLATALHHYQNTLVVKTEADFKAVLSYAESHNIQGFSLVCEERLTQQKTAQATPPPSWDTLLNKTLPHALGSHLLHSVACASNTEEALCLHQQESQYEVVTEKGIHVDVRGVIFFIGKGEGSVFVREAELKALTERLKHIEARFEKLDATLNTLENKQKVTEDKFRETDRELRQGEMRLVEANFSLQQIKEQKVDAEQKFKALSTEAETQKSIIRTLSEELRQIDTIYTQTKQQAQKNQGAVERLEGELERWESAQKSKKDDFESRQARYNEVKQKHQALSHQIELFQTQEREIQRQQSRLDTELENLTALETQSDQEGESCDDDLSTLEADLKQAEERLKKAEALVHKRKERIGQIESELERVGEQLKVKEDKLHKLGLKLTQLRSNWETICTELRDRHELNLDTICSKNFPLSLPLEEAERRVKHLRKLVEDASDINLAAIDECERHRSRSDFLSSQLQDLNHSKDELLQVIAKMEEESRKIFGTVFAQIRENFRRNFEILFRGGEADLTFVDGEDILKAGIEIIAKPPGKQMRSIQLLSGGEKCLTAMALLFSIFEVKHAPFCLLDEIDAPLDDSNIERFVNIVKKFNESQFIIITHNKRTMAIADSLFGVTMEEPGVSKILSLSFNHESLNEEERVLLEQIS